MRILLRGGSVFGGYLGMASDGCRSVPNSFHTKDIGALDGDLLYCRGRKDHQVKYEGYRIELGDIEQNLLQIDGVREAVVCAKRKSGTGVVRLLKAFVVASTSDLDEKAIKSALAEKIAGLYDPENDHSDGCAAGKCERKIRQKEVGNVMIDVCKLLYEICEISVSTIRILICSQATCWIHLQ